MCFPSFYILIVDSVFTFTIYLIFQHMLIVDSVFTIYIFFDKVVNN